MQKMKFLLLLCVIGIFSGYANDVNVAFVIGVQDKEADQFTTENGWQLTRYRDTELEKLAGSLNQYQIVIWGSLAGYQKNLPWQNYNQALRQYIENGGIFIVLDGNYASATTDIFGSWGNDFQLKRNTQCIMQKHQKGVFPKIDRKFPVNRTPYELYGLFDGYPDGWAHFEALPRAWQVLARCPDNGAFMIMRHLGQGSMAVLAYALFNIHERQIMLEALASNLLAEKNQRKEGFRITAFNLSDRFEKGNAHIELSGKVAAATAEVLLNGKTVASQELKVGMNEIPFEVDELGKLRFILKKQGNPIVSKHVEVVAPIALASTRYTVYPLIANQVRLYVKAAEKDFLSAQYQIAFFVDEKPFATVKQLENGIFLADFSSLAPGEYEISARLMEHDKMLFNAKPVNIKIMEKNPRVAISTRGIMEIEGKPFFPLGLYHVSKDDRLPLEKRDEVLRFAAENGYNMLHVSVKRGEAKESFQKFLHAARERNIMILPESDQLTQSVQWYAGDPAILGWNIGDEPDLEGISAAVFQQRMRDLKVIDAEHPSYTVFMRTESVEKYWPVTELVAVDPYPVPRHPLDAVYKSVASTRDALTGTASGLIAVLQGFGYENDPTFTLPSNRQVRNMFYQALVAGAKGIIFYTYQDGRFYLPDHPALCELLKSLPAEFKELEDFLLSGEYRELPTNVAGVYAAEWKKEGATLVIAVNTTGRAVQIMLNGKRISIAPEEVNIQK